MKQPLVSIIIPCYNNRKTITETIDSVLKQTYKNVEIIVIDDGSTEDIKSEIEPLKNNQNNLYFYQQENRGVSSARNLGASKSNGEFIIFLDADDLIEQSYIEKCLKVFLNNENVKIVYSKAKFFGRENSSWNLEPFIDLKKFLIGNCIFISAMIKKADFERVNGFDTSLDFYEDWDLWISILKEGGNVVQINEELFFYRTHENYSSASDKAQNKKQTHALNRLKIYNKHYNLYEKHYTHFEQIFLTYIESLNPKRKEKKWYQKIFKS